MMRPSLPCPAAAVPAGATPAAAAPLVILPGLMCDSTMFEAQLAAFPGSIVVDGFYGAARSMGAMADYALARMPERASLLGHSMGARVALEIVARAPERVERLSLVSTGTHAVSEQEPAARYALLELGRRQGMAALVERWLPPMLSAPARADRALLERLRAMCISAGLETYEAQMTALLTRPLLDDLLPAIACPTFAIVGSEDRWSPPAQHAAFVARIPPAELRVIEGAGHMLPAELPGAFNPAVEEWLMAAVTGRA